MHRQLINRHSWHSGALQWNIGHLWNIWNMLTLQICEISHTLEAVHWDVSYTEYPVVTGFLPSFIKNW